MSLTSCAPLLLIQGDVGGTVASVKVAVEKKILEAGSTIVEGIDRLYKSFWVFNMQYPDNCGNVFKFLGHSVYNVKGQKLPPTVLELSGLLHK